jgi:SWI/SNF-related matrix-associated actin-dependent regulator of chromatin subfamily A-like protein 1
MPHLPLGRCPFCSRDVTSADLIASDRVRCPNFRCRREVGIAETQQHARQVRAEAETRRRAEERARQERVRQEADQCKAANEKRRQWQTIVEMPYQGHTLRHRQAMDYMPFQRDGICFLIDKPATLLADEMGLGKTIQAIGLINSLDLEHVLIICPASLKLNWDAELRKWLTRHRGRTITVVEAARANLQGTILIINYEILDRFADALSKRPWQLIVADESQRIKNPDAKRTRAFLTLDAPRRVMLTGTPILNRPRELWTSLHWLAPDEWDDQGWFERRYCAAQDTAWGYNARGASNLRELNEKLCASLMLRRRKKEVLKDLPPKVRQVIRLPCADTAALRAEADLCARLEQEKDRLRKAVEDAQVLGNDAEYKRALLELQRWEVYRLGEISRVRHETALLKVPNVVEHLSTVVEETGKVLCFAHHRDVVERIQEHFNGESVILYGGMSATAKRDAVHAFQNDPGTSLFIGNILSAGEGLTLTAASNVVFAELDWTPARLTQCEDRAHRIGQRDNVLVQHLVVDGSIDAMIAEKLVEKQGIIEQAIDGVTVDLNVDEVIHEFLKK